jgi:glycolate oxidase FAD binding subunit
MAAETSAHEQFAGPNVELLQTAPEYEFDGIVPRAVVRPSSQPGAADVLRVANANGTAVFPRGGGTQMALGMPPERGGVVLDLRGLDRVVEYEPADLTVTAEAGMTLARLQDVLGEHGQWLPLDPPCAPEVTIGGILATNASGPARHSKGTARDLVIGMQFATAQGELVKTGGRVVKNVAGYDLGKLQIGALGTLGVITQVTFKVSPLPVSTCNIFMNSEDLGTLTSLARDIANSQLPVQGLAIIFRPTPVMALQVRLAAGQSAVERAAAEIHAMSDTFGVSHVEGTDYAWSSAVRTPYVVSSAARGSAIPSKLPNLLHDCWELSDIAVAYPSAGVVHLALKEATNAAELTSLRKRFVDAGGALVIERGPLALRRTVGVWGEPRGDFALMQRLKAELDPGRVLNPGRFVGGI